MIYTEIETLCGEGVRNRASVLPIALIVSIRYHNFRNAF